MYTQSFFKKVSICILILILAVVFVGCQGNKDSSAPSGDAGLNVNDYFLESYPIDVVPLYEGSTIDSMMYFVNDDPNGYAIMYDGQVNYYNVVLKVDSSQSDFISYYKSLMSSVDDEYTDESSVEGKIGIYGVEASKYSDDSSDAYLQVYLPTADFKKENPYFIDYPELFAAGSDWILHETSYGKLNQLGGQIEYTLYYTFNGDFKAEFDKFVSDHSDETNVSYEDKIGDYGYKGSIEWQSDEYEITVSFNESHGRIYVMIRKPI